MVENSIKITEDKMAQSRRSLVSFLALLVTTGCSGRGNDEYFDNKAAYYGDPNFTRYYGRTRYRRSPTRRNSYYRGF